MYSFTEGQLVIEDWQALLTSEKPEMQVKDAVKEQVAAAESLQAIQLFATRVE